MDNSIKLLFTGDFIPPENSDNILSEELIKILKDKDFSIVNLETPLTRSTEPIKKGGNNFKVDPKFVQHIKDGFFDAVTLSNNHIRDYGKEGVIDTVNVCAANNILTVGAGKNLKEASQPLRLNIRGKKISILNYSEREFNIASEHQAGANPYDTINSYYDIQNEKYENDYVIVIYHGGIEYQYYPTTEMVKNFKFMIDVGADSVVAHHSHRYSGTLVYKEKPIFFGLGNFISPTKSKVTDDWLIGLMVRLELKKSSVNFHLIPVKMSGDFKNVYLMDSEDANNILIHIRKISDIISNKIMLVDYWKKYDKVNKERIFRLLKSNSRFEYRLRKYLPKLFCNRITQYKRNTLLNMIRCDSHRNMLITILEKYKVNE